MPNDYVYVSSILHRVFDGTNADDILDGFLAPYPASYISASANYPGASATLQIRTDTPENGGFANNFTVGDAWQLNGNYGVYSAAVLTDTSYAVPLSAFCDTRVALAITNPTLAVGYAVTPSLIIGASATVAVPMVPSLPDAGYNVAVALAGSAQLLGGLAILSATVAGSAQVDVVVQNNGLLTLAGATVLVTALHNG
jgi:hypothetical protein